MTGIATLSAKAARRSPDVSIAFVHVGSWRVNRAS